MSDVEARRLLVAMGQAELAPGEILPAPRPDLDLPMPATLFPMSDCPPGPDGDLRRDPNSKYRHNDWHNSGL